MRDLDSIIAAHTLAVVRAALSDDPDGGLRAASLGLGSQGLSAEEVGHVYAGSAGEIAALFQHLVPPGIARKQFVASLEVMTTLVALRSAVHNLPRNVRGQNRKGNRK